MMKTFTLLTLTLWPAFIYPQQGQYFVHGQLAIQKIPEWVYLHTHGASQPLTDSVEIVDGAFVFSGMITSPVMASLYTGKNLKQAERGYVLLFYLEPDTIFISSPDTLRHAQVAGGPANAYYQQLKQQLSPVYAQLQVFGRAYVADMQHFFAGPDQAEQPMELLNGIYRQKFKAIEALHWRISKQFAGMHPDTIVSLDAIYRSASGNTEAIGVSAAINQLSVAVKDQVKAGFVFP